MRVPARTEAVDRGRRIRGLRVRSWVASALSLALATTLTAGPEVDAPEELRLEDLPAIASLDDPSIPTALRLGHLAMARRLTAAWRFRNPTGQPPPVEPLTQVLYRLSLGHREVRAGPLVIRTAPQAAPLSPEMRETLVEGYTRLARRILGVAPPPVRVHVVQTLPGALHGVHLGGHVAVEREGLPEVLFHELGHFLLSLHPGGRRLGQEMNWLEEGLCEWLARGDTLLLRGRPPVCSQLPEAPGQLFPSPDLARRPPPNVGDAYLPAAIAASLVEGGTSPFREGVPGLLRRLAAGEGAAEALRAVTHLESEEFASRWRERMRGACLPEALERARGPVRSRLGVVDATLRGDLALAARRLAAAAAGGTKEGPGGVLPWMVRDAIVVGGRLVRDPEGKEALGELARAVPWAGLAIPGAFLSEAWRQPLERLLAEGPPPRALLYLTLMLWETPHRQAVQAAWTQGFARHAEQTEWLQAAIVHTAFMGRLEPVEDAPYARVSQRLETIARKLVGREDRARDLSEAVAEARGAYAFGAKDYATAEAVLRTELAEAGWDPRRALNLAASLYRKGDLAEAGEVYRRALMLAPEHSGLRVGLAQIALGEERWEDAAQLLAGLDPKGEDGYRVLEGRLRVAEARGDEAEQARWKEALEKVEKPPSDSPVPALFQVMIFTPLDDLVLDLTSP